MAGFARRRSRQVIRRLGQRGHTGKHLTVMAVGAIAEYTGVNHRRSGEIGELARRVTGFTRRRSRQVVTWFGHRAYTDKYLTVVAR